MECCTSQAYNSYTSLQNLCYKAIEYLMLNNEDLWKLLRYNTPDALFKENLTLKEKAKLIYDGIGDSSNYRVFRSPYMDDLVDLDCAQLRVYLEGISPDTTIYGTADINFEVVSHVKIINLAEYKNRLEMMIQQILETLNGVYIGAIGNFVFDRTISFYDLCKLNLYNNRNFYGYSLIMSTKVGNKGKCDI